MSNARSLTLLLAVFTLVAFAANSIFCRLALMQHSIGPLEFTVVRLISGMLILLPIPLLFSANHPAGASTLAPRRSNFMPSLTLLGYALFFSLAYVQLDAAVGALILFAAVQITMVGVSILQGNRLTAVEWLGFVLAFGGLVYLLLPGLTAPPLVGASLMMLSGVSWGLYSLLGKQEMYPILSTARNFLFCLPGCFILIAILSLRSADVSFTSHGLILAAVSGGITSGLGYVLWYLTLKRITTTVASIAQLAVPVIAGLGGVIFLSETISLRLVSASVFIIGGIVVTILGRRRLPYPVPQSD